MWIRVPVHCQCRGHCPLRQPCHRAKVGCQSRCQCVAAVTVPRERDERCPRGLCLPVGYCASTPGYPNSGIPAGIRNQESDSGMGPTRSRFLIPVPSQEKGGDLALGFRPPRSLSTATGSGSPLPGATGTASLPLAVACGGSHGEEPQWGLPASSFTLTPCPICLSALSNLPFGPKQS